MKPKQWNNLSAMVVQTRFNLPNASASSINITGGSSTKETLYEFTKAISVRETETEESPGKTLESYVAMLDNWDQEQTLSDADEQREGS
jgi:hypothetical protein